MNKTINQLTNLAEISSNDELPIWDNSAGDTKKVSVENLGEVIIKNFNTYSTTERFTGKYWIDGKPIYSKTTVVRENGTTNPNITQSGTTYTIANDFFSQNEETVINVVAHAKRSTGIWDTITSGSADIYCMLISSNSIGFKFSGVTNTNIYVTVEYTKSTT